MFDFEFVASDEQYEAASILFKEYASSLNIDLSFQLFDKELEQLKKMYVFPKGMILLCSMRDRYVACVAVRPNVEDIAEIKRMYVKPAFQQQGIGQQLLDRAIDFCIKAGYKKVRLDTLNTMHPAMNLYLKNGFQQIEAYYHNPSPEAVYFEKEIEN
jgi:ribosomal protein S18 acetylase RimI-like enzyme